jgi:two-component system, sensor histidine kinase and response regulator
MKLRTKLLAATGAYQMLLVVVGLVGLLAAQAALSGLEIAVQHHIHELDTLGVIASEVNHVHSLSVMHALSDSVEEQDQYEREIAGSEAHVQALLSELLQIQERYQDQGDIDGIQDFERAWAAYLRVQDEQLLALRGPGHLQEAVSLIGSGGPLAQPYEEVTNRLASLQALLPSEATERLTLAQGDFSRNRDLLLAIVVLAACCGITFGVWQSARLARSVQAVSRAARRVAGGDLSQRVHVKTGDEIESLADSFNVMTNNLERMALAQSEHVHELQAANQALQSEVTERRRAEAALRESQTKFRSVTQSVNEAIVSTDRGGRINFWNSGAERIFGYTEEKAMGMSFAQLLPAHENGTSGSIEGGPDGGPADWSGETLEIVGKRKDGSSFPLEISVSEWTTGVEHFYTSTMRDVTERRAVEQLKHEFVSMVSHELRTPMNGVIGMIDLLLRTELNARQQAYADALEHSGRSLLGLIDDIIDFSKIEAGKFALEPGDVDVRDLVESSAALLCDQAGNKGLEIICMVDDRLPDQLRGDPRRLHQVLLNLIGNAVKFTHAGEIVVNADLQSDSGETAVVRFEVADSGIGIPDEVRNQLFQPFAQVHDSSAHHYGGTGLGLAISKRLIELMGGSVGVDSSPGTGSRFWFTAPFSKQPGQAYLSPRDTIPELAGARVLVVDDNPTTCAAIERQLASCQADCSSAHDLDDALGKLRVAAAAGESIAVLLLDMHLPNRGSQTLLRLLKTDPRLSQIRVVALTTAASDWEEHLSESTVAAVLDKPVRRNRLFEVLAEVIRTPAGEARYIPLRPSLATLRQPPLLPVDDQSRPRVLVVEDAVINQLAATSMLAELGYTADVAADGHAGLAALESTNYDVVLMDCQMPRLDGFQTTAEIRRREDPRHRTPIVAMTASAMLGDRERCLAAGMDDYLSKPVRLAELEVVLKRWLVGTRTTNHRPGSGTTIADSPPGTAQNPWQNAERDRINRSNRSMLGDVQAQMLSIFRAEAPQRLAALQEAVDTHDGEALRVVAHTLRGTAAAVGADAVRDLSADLERLGRTGELGAASVLDRLREALDKTCAAAVDGVGTVPCAS